MKIICLNVIYNKFKIIEEALTQFYNLSTAKIDRHIIFNNIYPLDTNDEMVSLLAKKLGTEYVCLNRNIGLFNAIEMICKEEPSNSLVIVNESNNFIIDHGFDQALITAYHELKEKDNEIVVSLGNKNNKELVIHNKNNVLYSIENNGEKKKGFEPKGYPYAGVNIASSSFLYEVINRTKNKYYGDPYKEFIENKRIGYILRSHNEISDYFYEKEDEVYRVYKMMVLYLDYKKSFEEYIKVHNENVEYTTMMIGALNRISPKIVDYIKYKKNNLDRL